MRHLHLVVSCGVFSIAFATTAGRARPSERSRSLLTAPYETRDPGQRLYVRQGCYQCHGLVGQGSILSGPGLSPLKIDSAAFRKYVRNPNGAMPPYTVSALPDADLVQIERFIRSLPRARTFTSIPSLASFAPAGARPGAAPLQPDGSILYQRNCAACHGDSREGGIGPSLLGQGKKRDVGAIAALVANPPDGMPKLSPRPLSAKDVEAIARFVARN